MSLLLNGFLEISAPPPPPPEFISVYATGFIARQVNGETWVQILHLNVKQCQI